MKVVELAYKVLRYCGLPFLLREVLSRRHTRIVVFHDPGVQQMERAMTYLTGRYNVISLDEFLSGKNIPPKALIVTLDDGHICNAELLPVFKRYGVRPTIFLCTGLIGTKRHFWFLHKPTTVPVPELKRMNNARRLLEMSRTGHVPESEFDMPQALSWEQVGTMKDHVDFGSHGVFHSLLPSCSDPEAWQDIARSKEQLEARLGHPVGAFAFPNGDYCARDVALVKRAGYTCALSMDYGFNTRLTDRFRLKRLSIDDGGFVDAISVKASGVWTLFRIFANRQRVHRMAAGSSSYEKKEWQEQ